jgi:uncharacterized protein YdbL (DUF1318 family)
MVKTLKVGLFFIVFSVGSLAQFYSGTERKQNNSQYGKTQPNYSVTVTNDSYLIQAVNQQKNVHYLEAANIQVTKLLEDDTQGREHQKFVARLSNGKVVQIVSNLDMCERIPVSIGDVVSVGGEFIWTKNGGLVHWVHRDPKGIRKDGYVALKGKFYCR